MIPLLMGTREEWEALQMLNKARYEYDAACLNKIVESHKMELDIAHKAALYKAAQDRFYLASREAPEFTPPFHIPTTQDAGSLDDAGAPLLIGNAGAIK